MNNYTFIGLKNKKTGKCVSNDTLRDDVNCDSRHTSFIQGTLGNPDKFILLNVEEKQCVKNAQNGGYVMSGMREDYACSEFDTNALKNGIKGYTVFAKKSYVAGPLK
jgi:hypothetical protein